MNICRVNCVVGYRPTETTSTSTGNTESYWTQDSVKIMLHNLKCKYIQTSHIYKHTYIHIMATVITDTYIKHINHIYTHIYVNTSTTYIKYMLTYIHIHAYIHTYNIYACIYTHTYIHAYKHTYIPTYIHTYIIHTYTHIYIYTYIHTYIYTYTHTYIHTYTRARARYIQLKFLTLHLNGWFVSFPLQQFVSTHSP